MRQIAICSNKTRADQRPPLQRPLANAALLAKWGFTQSHKSPNVSPKKKFARTKKESGPVASALPVPAKPAAAAKPPIIRPQPGRSSQVQQKPEDIPQPRVGGKPPLAKQTSSAEQPLAAKQAQAQPDPKERQLPAQKQPDPRLPQLRKYNVNPLPSRPPGAEKRFPLRPPTARGQTDPQKPSETGAPSRPSHSLVPYQPADQQSPRKSAEKPSTGIQPVGSNGSPLNGKDHAAPHSSLFRPGAFASLPALRVPPRNGSPVQPPPTQIPMEVYTRRDEEQGVPPENGKPVLPDIPATNPIPPVLAERKPKGLEQLLQQNPALPDQAAVLGVCSDGLPALLDLQDPAPGAMVVIGDERELQVDILRTAVASIAMRNSPRIAQFLVFSCEPEQWLNWAKAQGFDRHCLAIERAEPETVRDWIIRLADWTEQRRLGQSSGPSVLLVIDTLSFLTGLDYDIRLNFEWMAKEGPPAQIWPVAVISTDLAKTLSSRRLLRAFQTRVIGYANQPADYIPLAGLDAQSAETFGRRGEFAVRLGEGWLRFRLP